MERLFLHEEISAYKTFADSIEIPEIISKGLSPKIVLREYQEEAFRNFIINFNKSKNKQIHNLFHMATGSGKTVIMAGLILYLYTKGYRKFLFFVNQTNVLEKTIENFINPLSNKYLFNEKLEYLGNNINIKRVNNFSGGNIDDIEIIFTTTQKLHMDLFEAKENSITYDDFENNKIVFISDESHHINSLTKKPTKDEAEAIKSWEYSVTNALYRNRDSMMLEFTATCDLKDTNVVAKYKDKIVFNYPLISFRESGYTKDFQNFATDTDLWTRTLMSLIMSEYRRFLFADLKLNIKPVVMLKSQKIDESKSFYDEFFKKVKELTSYEIQNLELVGIERLTEAINYFKEKDDTLELLEQSIKTSFTEDTSIIMNGSSDNSKENQLLVNSLEDLDNPIRLIFAVDMLNEGWDVLNLFDIVRLYDTRQSKSGGKIGSYTIKEAQLIGRGARYCPFVVDDEELKFKRKFDGDLSNQNRLLETMYFHSKNDSRYISELKNALIETGLQAPDPIVLEYRLKDEFKDSDFYKKSYVFSNKRLLKGRDEVHSIEPSMRTKTYYYTAISGKGNIVNLIGNDAASTSTIKTNLKSIKFKDIDYNILLGAIECFEELRFDILKEKYPSLKSMREFLTSDEFLGNSNLEITYSQDEVNGKILFSAVKHALVKVASHVMAIKPEYVGSKEFEPKQLKLILKDKKISPGSIEGNGGKGNSQNNCSNEEYRLDLTNESWYVFNDNYGTSEEKLFIKYFKTHIEPKLKEKNLEYYVVRNERIPELAIYSFEAGERFEPDFLMFIRKQRSEGSLIYQGYVEPKGNQLLDNDAWKEDFSLQIEKEHSVTGLFTYDYKIIGFPFFNNDNRMEEFEEAINKWMEMM